MRPNVQILVGIVGVLSACALSHRASDAGGTVDTAAPVDVVASDLPALDSFDAPLIDADVEGPDVVTVDAVEVVQDSNPPDAGPILWISDFSALPAGACPVLPTGLQLTRPSVATVQTGSSTVVTQGIGIDTARIGRANDTDPLALVIEERRTNLISDGRDLAAASWQPSLGAVLGSNAATGPDGQVLADRIQVANDGYSPWAAKDLPAGRYWGSGWTSAGAAAANFQVVFGAAVTNGVASGGSAPVEWTRFALVRSLSAPSSEALVVADGRNALAIGGVINGARDELLDMLQWEPGWFPSEWIETDGAPATRAADELRLSPASLILSGGQIALEFILMPKGDTADLPTALPLFALDALNFARIDRAGVQISVGGVEQLLPLAVSWHRHDVVEVFVRVGAGTPVAALRVGGGAVQSAVGSSATDALAAVGPLSVLSDGSGIPFSAWVVRMVAYRGGGRPAWMP